MKILLAAVLIAAPPAHANEPAVRKYYCESDSGGVSQIRGRIQPGYGFNPTDLVATYPTYYPWGAKLSFEADVLRIDAISTGDPDLPQPGRPNLVLPSQTDPRCVFQSNEGDPIPKNVTPAVQSCIPGKAEGLIIHPFFLEGRPIYDQVPKSGGFTIIWFKRVGRSVYDQFSESFGCTRLK